MPFFNRHKLLYAALLTLLSACSSAPRQHGPAVAGSELPALPGAYEQALTLMGNGDYSQAVALLEKFIEEEPGFAGPYLNLGIAYRQTGQPDAAFKALQKAIELNPANAAAHHQIAIVHREQGNFDAALEAYTRALELAPDYALAHRNLGILYDLYLQQPALALNHYRRYLDVSQEPDSRVRDWVVDLERRVDNAQAKAE